MASPFPFTSGQVLTAAQLNSIGEPTAFTPSWSNFTVGNAAESWYYTQVNDLIVVQGVTTLGSTSAVTGTWNLDYPVGSPATSGPFAGFARLTDATGSTLIGTVLLGASLVSFRAFAVSGSDIGIATVNASTPFTWTTSDQLYASFVYQLS